MITHLFKILHIIHFKIRRRLNEEVPKLNIITAVVQDMFEIKPGRIVIILAMLSLRVNKIIPEIMANILFIKMAKILKRNCMILLENILVVLNAPAVSSDATNVEI